MITVALFRTKIKGQKELEDKFKRGKSNLNKLRGANLAAAVTIQKWVIKNIDAEGRLHNSSQFRWPPLSPATIAARRTGPNATLSPKPLQDTGRLKQSFQVSATEQFGLVQSRVNYASVHEDGTKNVPQRKLFPTSRQGEELVKPAYEAFIKKAVK